MTHMPSPNVEFPKLQHLTPKEFHAGTHRRCLRARLDTDTSTGTATKEAESSCSKVLCSAPSPPWALPLTHLPAQLPKFLAQQAQDPSSV